MKLRDDNLVDHIRETLREYEEPYVPGNWERFNEGQTNRKGFISWKRYASAAAILLFGVGLYLSIHETPPEQDNAARSKITTRTDLNTIPETDIKELKPGVPVNASSVVNDIPVRSSGFGGDKKLTVEQNNQSMPPDQPNNKGTETLQIAVKENLLSASSLTDLATDNSLAAGNGPKKAENGPITPKRSFQEFLDSEEKSNANNEPTKPSDRKADRWMAGVLVSPSYGNTKKLNVGYGVTMAYSLSDKIELSSGIAYNEMAASKQFHQTGTMLAANLKTLEHAESKISGLDIPLEVNYRLNKNLYANIGVSAFAVLERDRSNTYTEAKIVERLVSTNTGGQELRSTIENHRTTSKIPNSESNEANLLGLYNFSFGYKQTVAGNKAVSVEPFLKVPIKKVTGESLSMMATGVRFRFEF